METLEYRTIDKSAWPDGPWKEEPDKVQYTDPATGLPCLLVRHGHGGFFCGYVGVAEGHPLYGRPHDEDPVWELLHNVTHHRVNFSDFCEPNGAEDRRVCHVPAPGEPDHVWWFGFDTGHYEDFSPGDRNAYMATDATYKDRAWMERELAGLAKALWEMVAH